MRLLVAYSVSLTVMVRVEAFQVVWMYPSRRCLPYPTATRSFKPREERDVSSTFGVVLYSAVSDVQCLEPVSRTLDEYSDDEPCNPRSSFGTKEYWDDVYAGQGDFPATEYSWYFGWTELKRLVAPYLTKADRILIPGIGNDPLLTDLVQAGYAHLAAQDYSLQALERQYDLLHHYCGVDENAESLLSATSERDDLFAPNALTEPMTLHTSTGTTVQLHCSNVVKSLPVEWTKSFTVIIEKGLLDAVYLSSEASDATLHCAVARLADTMVPGGIFVSVSGVVPDEQRRRLFPTESDTGGTTWEWLRDGTNDLKAGCFLFRKI